VTKLDPITGRNVEPQGDATALNERLYLALARHRRGTGAKQYEVAARAGVSPAELSRWIYGERQPSRGQAHALATALGASVPVLFPHLKDVGLAAPGWVEASDAPSRHDPR